MAILQGDSGTVELQFTDERLAPSQDVAYKRAAGGSRQQQFAGELFKLNCRARVTSALFRSTMDILKDRSEMYFYTPEQRYDLYPNLEYPIPVLIKNIGEEWDNRKVHYIKFTVEALDYI